MRLLYHAGEIRVQEWEKRLYSVMKVAELGSEAVKFVAEPVIGYIVRSDGTTGNPAEAGQILAMPAF